MKNDSVVFQNDYMIMVSPSQSNLNLSNKNIPKKEEKSDDDAND